MHAAEFPIVLVAVISASTGIAVIIVIFAVILVVCLTR